jgi:hypothetical protein
MTTQNETTRYEVVTQEDPETGDLLLPFPEELLTKLGWKEGDTLSWKTDKDGQWIITKV